MMVLNLDLMLELCTHPWVAKKNGFPSFFSFCSNCLGNFLTLIFFFYGVYIKFSRETFFFFFFGLGFCFVLFLLTGFYYVAQASSEVLILPPHPPKCWNCRHEPLRPPVPACAVRGIEHIEVLQSTHHCHLENTQIP